VTFAKDAVRGKLQQLALRTCSALAAGGSYCSCAAAGPQDMDPMFGMSANGRADAVQQRRRAMGIERLRQRQVRRQRPIPCDELVHRFDVVRRERPLRMTRVNAGEVDVPPSSSENGGRILPSVCTWYGEHPCPRRSITRIA